MKIGYPSDHKVVNYSREAHAVVEHGAALIVIGSPEKPRLSANRQEAFFGQTVNFVLRKAPCRVIVTHFPSEQAVEAAHAAPYA